MLVETDCVLQLTLLRLFPDTLVIQPCMHAKSQPSLYYQAVQHCCLLDRGHGPGLMLAGSETGLSAAAAAASLC